MHAEEYSNMSQNTYLNEIHKQYTRSLKWLTIIQTTASASEIQSLAINE